MDGMVRVQHANGGFNVLLEQSFDAAGCHRSGDVRVGRTRIGAPRMGSPPTTAQSRRRHGLSSQPTSATRGCLRNTYYLWALPAENRDMRLRDESSGWARASCSRRATR